MWRACRRMRKWQNHKCYSTRYLTIESLFDVNVWRACTKMKKWQNHKCYSTRYSTIESLLDVNVREYFNSQMHVISSAFYDSRVATIKSLISTRHFTESHFQELQNDIFNVMRSCNCCTSNISTYDNDVIISNCKTNLTHFNDAKFRLYRCQMQKILWNEIYICFNCSQAWMLDISKRISFAYYCVRAIIVLHAWQLSHIL